MASSDENISPRALDMLIETAKRMPPSAVADEALAWLKCKRAEINSPRRQVYVFWLDCPGYVTLGRLGEERTLEHPGLDGLGYLHQILLAGVAAGSYLDAAAILKRPGRSPGTTLANALGRAADWLEYQARCLPLATAARAPSVSVAKDGSIRVDVSNRPHIDLA